MAEVHIIGEIESASGFPEQRLFCRWELVLGKLFGEIFKKFRLLMTSPPMLAQKSKLEFPQVFSVFRP